MKYSTVNERLRSNFVVPLRGKSRFARVFTEFAHPECFFSSPCEEKKEGEKMILKNLIKRLEADLIIWRVHRYIRKLESTSQKEERLKKKTKKTG